MHFGIAKLIEESGEWGEALSAFILLKMNGKLQQLLGKTIAFPVGPHPDGEGVLRERLLEEIADNRAAQEYYVLKNYTGAEIARMQQRHNAKLDKFFKWGLTGVPEETINAEPGPFKTKKD